MSMLIPREARALPSRRHAVPALDPFRFAEAFFGGDVFVALDTSSGVLAFAPSFEVRETKDAYVFKADVPGVAEKDLDVQLKADVLTISGERKREGAEEGERYFAVERAYGRFSRAFSLPEGTDGEHVTADVKDGVLTLRVPKKPQAQPRRIAIGAAPKG
jgi:HSP20 family protein